MDDCDGACERGMMAREFQSVTSRAALSHRAQRGSMTLDSVLRNQCPRGCTEVGCRNTEISVEDINQDVGDDEMVACSINSPQIK